MIDLIRQNYLSIIIILVGIAISVAIVVEYKKNTIDFFEPNINGLDLSENPIDPKKDLIRGAPVPKTLYVVEYGDLQCPYCQEFHPYIQSLLKTEYARSGEISWVFRHAPHLGKISVQKAQLTECIRNVEGDSIAWEFIDESLAVVDEATFPINRYNILFETRGWDANSINKCFNGNATRRTINAAIEIANSYKIDRTPYLQFLTPEGNLLFEHTGVLTLLELDNIIENIASMSR